jgi:hypothetical protein
MPGDFPSGKRFQDFIDTPVLVCTTFLASTANPLVNGRISSS